MVTENHYRWDFIGLSTDEKPTPATSEKVVDGSTFYCSDTSKLYVYCKDNWYERKALGGGGGGGTTYTAGDGITIADDTISVDLVQATGSDTKKVMSQDATTKMIYRNVSANGINIGGDASSTGTRAIAIGSGAYTSADDTISLNGGLARGKYSIAIGENARTASGVVNQIAIGHASQTSNKGEMNIGCPQDTTFGYNDSEYRLLTGLYDPQNAHDAATKGYVDSHSGGVKTLTSADYNYHYGGSVDDGIALWLLDEGQYIIGDNVNAVKYYYSSAQYISDQNPTGIIVVKKPVGTRRGFIIEAVGGTSNNYIIRSIDTSGNNGERTVLPTAIANNLTTSSVSMALSAEQGKTLKDLIDSLVIKNAGAPTTSTAGTVGQLLEDTTNGDLYICTDATNPYVWEQVGAGGGSITPVQTTGTSTTDVMSQNAVTSMVFADPSTMTKIKIGESAGTSEGTDGIEIGHSAFSNGEKGISIGSSANSINAHSIAFGANARARSERSLALGASAIVDNSPAMAYSVALGANSITTRAGEVNIGTGINNFGYNSTPYRVIGGVHDGQDAHDAATLAQGNTLSTSAPTTSTVGVLGQLYTDTTNMHTYQCTAISGDTYTWTQRW